MLSKEYEADYEDGNWVSKLEAAIAFSVTERTIENRIKSGSISSRLADDGKTEVFLRKVRNLTKPYEADAGFSNHANNANSEFGNTFENSSKVELELKSQIAELQAELLNIKVEYAQLKGESMGKDKLLEEKDRHIASKDEVIRAKEQAINAANAAVMLLEKQSHAIETESNRQITGSPSEDQKKGWFDKILGR